MNSMATIVAVLLGGASGSLLRWLMATWVSQHLPKNFPWGILCVNICGSLCIGLLAGLLTGRYGYVLGTVWRAGMMVGLLGGFTTFSSFSLDTIILLQSGAFSLAVVNIMASLLCSLTATALGMWLVEVMVASCM